MSGPNTALPIPAPTITKRSLSSDRSSNLPCRASFSQLQSHHGHGHHGQGHYKLLGRLTTMLGCLWLVALPTLGQSAPTGSRADEDVRIHNERLYEKSAKAAQAAMAYYGEYDNAEEKLRVHEIGFRLAAESDWTRFPFSFYLVDMPIPNAFALPGGHIFITPRHVGLGADRPHACLPARPRDCTRDLRARHQDAQKSHPFEHPEPSSSARRDDRHG